jgi:hypothetical protein
METWKHEDIDIETWKYREMETWRKRGMETWTYCRDVDMESLNGKRKPKRFSLINLSFAHHSLLFLCLLMKKQTELSVCKRTTHTKWTKQACPCKIVTCNTIVVSIQ